MHIIIIVIVIIAIECCWLLRWFIPYTVPCGMLYV